MCAPANYNIIKDNKELNDIPSHRITSNHFLLVVCPKMEDYYDSVAINFLCISIINKILTNGRVLCWDQR